MEKVFSVFVVVITFLNINWRLNTVFYLILIQPYGSFYLVSTLQMREQVERG